MKTVALSLFFILVSTVSFGQKQMEGSSCRPVPNYKRLTVYEFLAQLVTNESGGMLAVQTWTSFPKEWIKRSDIDTLIRFAASNQRCRGIVGMVSSHIPSCDHAELGGYVIELIKAYRQHRAVDFGLYACPQMDPVAAREMVQWWNEECKKSKK